MLLKYFKKPHKILWAISNFVLLLAIIIYAILGNSAIDVQMHDTYFVVSFAHFFAFLATIYAVFGFIYWSFRGKALIPLLTGFHIILSLIPLFSISYQMIYLQIGDVPRRYYAFASYDFAGGFINNLSTILMIFGFAQLLLILNVLISWYRNRKKER